MNILVISGDSALGNEVCQLLQKKNIPFLIPPKKIYDFSEEPKLKSYIEEKKPTMVVNLFSFDDPYHAENTPSLCFKINRDNVITLADTCKKLDIPLIHASTYLVFDGKKKDPYTESEKPNPLGVLATSRYHAERQILERRAKYVIIRFSWIIDEHGTNILTNILNQATQKDIISVTSDQIGCPTPIKDIARVIIAVIQQTHYDAQAWGIYHYNSEESMSLNAFAEFVIEKAAQYTHLKIKTIHLEKIASRKGIPPPANACLSCHEILNSYGIHRKSWHVSVDQMIKNFFQK